MVDQANRLKELLSFLSKEFASGAVVEPDQKLVPDLVDSLGVFVLVDFVHQRWGVTIDDRDLSIENLGSPRALLRLVEKHSPMPA